MIYTDLTRKAFKIAYEAHNGQVDKSGMPYIHHPLHVAEQMQSEDACIVALLHDVVEDTNVTFEDLEREGFPEECMVALKLLTKAKGEDYFVYLDRLKNNKLASMVKLADLNHNSDMTRLVGEPTEKDLQREQKYKRAMQILIHNKKEEDDDLSSFLMTSYDD